eukprot:6483401-Amphidinium_carterae.1
MRQVLLNSNVSQPQEVQFALREHLGVNIPLKIKGPYGAKVFVVIMPDTAAAIGVRSGLLLFEALGN